MHQQVTSIPPAGSLDVWDFDLLEVGGQMQCSHIRTFLFFLASPRTECAGVFSVNDAENYAKLRIYGPICEDGYPVFVEMHISASAKMSLKDNNLGRLAHEEIQLLINKLTEHVKERHPLFQNKTTYGLKRLFTILQLPKSGLSGARATKYQK